MMFFGCNNCFKLFLFLHMEAISDLGYMARKVRLMHWLWTPHTQNGTELLGSTRTSIVLVNRDKQPSTRVSSTSASRNDSECPLRALQRAWHCVSIALDANSHRRSASAASHGILENPHSTLNSRALSSHKAITLACSHTSKSHRGVGVTV
jgi:hypothetical protein